MSVFSDEDLARLKKALDCDNSCSGNVYLPHEDYAALLVRLDAAERYLTNSRQSLEFSEADYEAWKKSAGR